VIPNSWKVLHPSSPDENNGMFLEVMTNPRNISGDFDSIGQSHSGNLSKGGIRFLGSGCIDSYANPSFLGRSHQSGGRGFALNPFPSLPNQLIYGRHLSLSLIQKSIISESYRTNRFEKLLSEKTS
jgi:hypothetical protein